MVFWLPCLASALPQPRLGLILSCLASASSMLPRLWCRSCENCLTYITALVYFLFVPVFSVYFFFSRGCEYNESKTFVRWRKKECTVWQWFSYNEVQAKCEGKAITKEDRVCSRKTIVAGFTCCSVNLSSYKCYYSHQRGELNRTTTEKVPSAWLVYLNLYRTSVIIELLNETFKLNCLTVYIHDKILLRLLCATGHLRYKRRTWKNLNLKLQNNVLLPLLLADQPTVVQSI